MSLYLQINLWLAFTWLTFAMLPMRKLSFRTMINTAQILIVTSIAVPILLSQLPDRVFPQLVPVAKVLRAIDVDEGGQNIRQAIKSEPVQAVAQNRTNKIPFASILFFFGLIGMTLKWAFNAYRLRRLIRDSIPLHAIGRTRVAISSKTEVPFALRSPGRAHVILPATLLESAKFLKIAIKHEIEHHRSHDTLWAQIVELLICAFYLNPAVYGWKKSISELQELACDEALISRMGVSEHAYGSCLLTVAEMALTNRLVLAGTTGMRPAFENKSRSFLRRRIEMFEQHRHPPKKKTARALGTLVSFGVLIAAYAAQATLRSEAQIAAFTYDPGVERIANQSLTASVKKLGASGGFAIVSEAQTGRVLAAVSIDNGFDPALGSGGGLNYPLPPASTIKPIYTAAAIQERAISTEEPLPCPKSLSPNDTIAQSNNLCAIQIATKLGAPGLEQSLKDFGFKSVPASPGFATNVYIRSIALGGSGQIEFHVTPLEMVEAYGAIANGGQIMKPITAGESPSVLQNVLSPAAAAQTRQILRNVVTSGTGQSIRDSKIRLAGKTGTFEMPDKRRIGSFIGFAPADTPKLVVYVAIFDPKKGDGLGSRTAAPVFRDIVEKALNQIAL